MKKITTLKTGEYVTYWCRNSLEERELAIIGLAQDMGLPRTLKQTAILAIRFLNTEYPKPGYKWGDHFRGWSFGLYLEEDIEEEEEEEEEEEPLKSSGELLFSRNNRKLKRR